jgi:serine/threonine protein kinase
MPPSLPLPIAALQAAARKRGLLDEGNLQRLARRLVRDGVTSLGELRRWLVEGDINPRVGSTLGKLLCRQDDLSIGGCLVLAHLAEGGMGRVDLVDHEGELRVLKTLPAARSGRTHPIRRFRREAAITAQLVHPNIVPCHAHGEERGQLYLVLSYIPGGDVQQLLDESQRLSEIDALTIVHQVASGLAYAHDHHLVHRDIKPANVFITETGRLLVADFGLARSTDDESSLLTAPGGAVGTPCYMAPEQIRGETIDHRCDHYALGCVLHTALTGKPPWNGSLPEVLSGHLSGAIPDLRKLRADLGDITLDLHRRLLAKEPAERPATAQNIAELAACRLCELGQDEVRDLNRQAVVRSTRHQPNSTVSQGPSPSLPADELTADTQTDADPSDQHITDHFERADTVFIGELAHAESRPCFTLHRADGSALARLFALRECTIGRGPDSDVVLNESGKGIGRRHCRVLISADGGVALEDLVSANGTWLNEAWLPPGKANPLSVGTHRLNLSGHHDLDITVVPQRSPTTRQLAGAAPGREGQLGLETDALCDAIILSHREQAPDALVIRRVVLARECGDLPGLEDAVIEIARYRGVWILRTRPAPWQPLCQETLARIGLSII